MELPIHGQGVLIFDSCIDFYVYNSDETDGLHVQNCVDHTHVTRLSTGELFVDEKNTKGSHWFSIDAQNQKLYGGVGEARIETAVYVHKADKAFLDTLTSVSPAPIRIIKDPITSRIPLVVKAKCTMHDMARNKYMPRANLSHAAQKLYDCVENAKLNDDVFPDFGKAIEHSIVTPGCWCHETLKSKATEFGPSNPDETYLRITLGKNNGESPGVPYVMEIWPPGHYSPIHNHGGANAIINVLRGSINVSLFAHLGSEHPFAASNFSKGQVTWISPTLNQTHQLRNTGTKTCVTLQCYMYDSSDRVHYEYFDYLDESGTVKKFEPDSDMDFVNFRNIIMREWNMVSWSKKLF